MLKKVWQQLHLAHGYSNKSSHPQKQFKNTEYVTWELIHTLETVIQNNIASFSEECNGFSHFTPWEVHIGRMELLTCAIGKITVQRLKCKEKLFW